MLYKHCHFVMEPVQVIYLFDFTRCNETLSDTFSLVQQPNFTSEKERPLCTLK